MVSKSRLESNELAIVVYFLKTEVVGLISAPHLGAERVALCALIAS